MSTEGTTLAGELEQAAYSIESAASYLGGTVNRNVFTSLAARLRARAAHVREWGARLVKFRDNPNLPADNMIGPFTVSMFNALTGPLGPSSTEETPR